MPEGQAFGRSCWIRRLLPTPPTVSMKRRPLQNGSVGIDYSLCIPGQKQVATSTGGTIMARKQPLVGETTFLPQGACCCILRRSAEYPLRVGGQKRTTLSHRWRSHRFSGTDSRAWGAGLPTAMRSATAFIRRCGARSPASAPFYPPSPPPVGTGCGSDPDYATAGECGNTHPPRCSR